ncbi:MAG: 5-deoxy-glucuronate isomerase [candidate division WS1 bacterium]|nr:5-deoxy-glucuronate isomerase [candidate division WS1 bacterium]
MNGLLLRKKTAPGLTEIYSPGVGPIELLSFSIAELRAGESLELDTGAQEYAVVLLTGLVDLSLGEESYTGLGGRTSVFAGKATGAYLPPGRDCTLTAQSAAQIALCAAPAEAKREVGGVQIVRPEEVSGRRVGNWNWRRDVYDLIGDNVPQAQRLVVGETINTPGNWSSYPPHKHEVDNFPEEVAMEEVYYYRLNPPQGFGLQRVYTDDRSLDQTYAVEDGDTVLLPRGYHPVVAAPGYQLYYLWMLAGRTDRRMRPKDDPVHAWVKATGEMARDMGF